jgi:isopenicillin-N epimerase
LGHYTQGSCDLTDERKKEQSRADCWRLDPAVAFLNHGSFGACPRPVLETQQRLRDRMEREPVQFFARDLEGLLDDARGELAAFLGCPAEDLAFVPNATAAVNAVLRSLSIEPQDELLVTNHEYNASRNALEFAAARAGARVVVAEVPFPIDSPDAVVAAVMARVTPHTRLALLDHVTSQTGLVFPIERLVRALTERGVETLVDGAHAPGMLSLNISSIGAAYYTGNCHKWLCAPKGAAFLYVSRDRQAEIRPVAISHGANSPRTDRSRFLLEFNWTGTDDPTAVLCVPDAIRFMGSLLPGGWPALMTRNHKMVLGARAAICRALEIPLPCPDGMIGALAAFPLPQGPIDRPRTSLYCDPLQDFLLRDFGIEVPVIPWPAPPERLLRVSAQIYNTPEQYERLAEALSTLVS